MHALNYYLPDPATGQPLPWHHSRISPEQIEAAGRGETLESRATRLNRERQNRLQKKQARAAANIGNPRQRVPYLAFIDAMASGKLNEGDTVTLADLKELDIIAGSARDQRTVSRLCFCLCDKKSPWRLDALTRKGRKNPNYKRAAAPLAWIIRRHFRSSLLPPPCS